MKFAPNSPLTARFRAPLTKLNPRFAAISDLDKAVPRRKGRIFCDNDSAAARVVVMDEGVNQRFALSAGLEQAMLLTLCRTADAVQCAVFDFQLVKYAVRGHAISSS